MRALLALLCAALACAQDSSYRAYDGQGVARTLDEVVAAAQNADVIFLGETHDDSTAHLIELEILRRLQAGGRPLSLSLEMFERDRQQVLDEYLADQIDDRSFQQAADAWKNYKQDYRPLVEFAKQNRLPVVAANAPRRYVNRVSRLGAASLLELSAESKRWLPSLPLPTPSAEYKERFAQVMANHGGHGVEMGKALEAQSLWDAAMADAIAKVLQSQPQTRVLHVSGSFHMERGLGTPEQLRRLVPNARVLNIVVKPSDKGTAFDPKEMNGLGDFVFVSKKAK